jgi:hypothetical protein
MLSSRVSGLVVAAFAAAATLGSAQATTITQADLTQGATTVSAGGLTATATGGSFFHKTVAGVTGVGINGPTVPGEITQGENIKFDSATTQFLFSFEVTFLFPNGFQGDTVNEVALLGLADPAASITLTATSPTTATLAGAVGTVTLESVANNSGAGEWLVNLTSPVAFKHITFAPDPGGSNAAQGDFAFVSMTFAPAVPEVSTWAMMMLGFMGVGFMAYRRKGNGPSLRLV